MVSRGVNQGMGYEPAGPRVDQHWNEIPTLVLTRTVILGNLNVSYLGAEVEMIGLVKNN